MFTPNTPKDEQDEILPEWHEPFPEPNPFPSGWNLSSIVAALPSTSVMDADETVED